MLLDPKARLLTYFDNFMLIVIAYSCLITLFTIGFDLKIEYGCNKNDNIIFVLEMIVFVCFSIDIILNFMRLPQNSDVDPSHSEIAKKYVKTTKLF